MFSAELKVNGVIVGMLYGHNKGYADKKATPECDYYIEYHTFGEYCKNVVTGNIIHDRDDGLGLLVSKALEQLS